MSWSPILLISLVVLTLSVDSKHLGLPDPVKYISVSLNRQWRDGKWEPVARVKWQAYELDTTSYKIEFAGVNGGKSIIKNLYPYLDFQHPSFFLDIHDLKVNETYIVHVFAVNERGQSPPSPDIIFFMDESQIEKILEERSARPSAPGTLIQHRSGNQVNVTWGWVWYRENMGKVEDPLEFTFRYGDNKNTSLWKTLKTNHSEITLDDLKNGTNYSGYVFAKENNLTSLNSEVFPISLDQDTTGLPEPVITIEPAYKNGVFAPGDPIKIRCNVPQNINLASGGVLLVVGEQHDMKINSSSNTMDTTASMDVNTIKCVVYTWFTGRESSLSWKVEENPNEVQRIESS